MVMEFEQLNAQINITMKIIVVTRHLPSKIVDLMRDQIILMFNRDEAMYLTDPEQIFPKQANKKEKEKDISESIMSENKTKNAKLTKKRPSALSFTIRKRLNGMMEPYILLTPF